MTKAETTPVNPYAATLAGATNQPKWLRPYLTRACAITSWILIVVAYAASSLLIQVGLFHGSDGLALGILIGRFAEVCGMVAFCTMIIVLCYGSRNEKFSMMGVAAAYLPLVIALAN